MKKQGKNISAYMSLEVSMLFPIIIVMLLCLMYIFYFSYNRAMAFQNGAITALYAKGLYSTTIKEEVWAERAYDVLGKLNDSQYIALEELKQKVTKKKNDICVIQSGKMDVALLGTEFINKFNFIQSVTLDLQENTFYIRQVRKVLKNGSKDNK